MIDTKMMIDKKRPNEKQKDRKETDRQPLVVDKLMGDRKTAL